MHYFWAFGFLIQSDTPISQLTDVDDQGRKPDIVIQKADLDSFHAALTPGITCLFSSQSHYFETYGSGRYLVEKGSIIRYQNTDNATTEQLSAYLMGPCMGTALHQRGINPLHCSCVADDRRAIIICGDSGAGKSTLASEFMKNGWKLLTDDVAAVETVDQIPIVHPSYPSQKLWQDSLEEYKHDSGKIHSLYGRPDGMKYGVDVSDYFLKDPRPLSLIIWLVPGEEPCALRPVTGMEKIHLLVTNTYNAIMVMPEERQNLFRRCVELASKVPMVHLNRQKGISCAGMLYDMITEFLEEK